ncbi:MAG: cysteine hydrolase [Spongiibacteraceae bacterium]
MRGLNKNTRAALIISECQRGVIERELSAFSGLVDQVEERGIVSKIASLAVEFRRMSQTVVHAHVAHNKGYPDLPMTNVIVARTAKMGGMLVGSDDVDPVAELQPHQGDVVHERSFSLVAFNGTDFDSLLRHRGITTLILAGVSSNIAIPGMAVCAADLGYQVIVAEDCIAGASAETHDFSIKNTLPLFANVASSAEIIQALSAQI